jgi:hypothetical protein
MKFTVSFFDETLSHMFVLNIELIKMNSCQKKKKYQNHNYLVMSRICMHSITQFWNNNLLSKED